MSPLRLVRPVLAGVVLAALIFLAVTLTYRTHNAVAEKPLGPLHFVMPNVLGLPLARAESTLTSVGLVVHTSSANSGVANHPMAVYVEGQSVLAGSTTTRSAEVTLTTVDIGYHSGGFVDNKDWRKHAHGVIVLVSGVGMCTQCHTLGAKVAPSCKECHLATVYASLLDTIPPVPPKVVKPAVKAKAKAKAKAGRK